MARPVSERAVVLLIAAVQFINIVDFMMVMPLGPFFSESLGILRSQLGWVGGAYTAAAGVAGIVGSTFLDRFDRRKALAVAMGGLVLGTAAGGFATDYESLLLARVVAGMFGGPATSLSFAIIADLIPLERRGRATGTVMGAFSISSVLAVPASLELARQLGWRAPFFCLAGLGVVVVATTIVLLPSVRAHLDRGVGTPALSLFRPDVLWSYAMTAVTMMAGFLIIPNLPSYILGNLQYPEHRYGLLYAVGGATSLVLLRIGGHWVDKVGSFPVVVTGTALLSFILVVGFISPLAGIPTLALFVGFMSAMSFRNVAYNSLTTKVPEANERSRFMSLQSAVQHFASALGAFLSAKLLSEAPGGRLAGMPRVATIALVLTLLLPGLVLLVERRVR